MIHLLQWFVWQSIHTELAGIVKGNRALPCHVRRQLPSKEHQFSELSEIVLCLEFMSLCCLVWVCACLGLIPASLLFLFGSPTLSQTSIISKTRVQHYNIIHSTMSRRRSTSTAMGPPPDRDIMMGPPPVPAPLPSATHQKTKDGQEIVEKYRKLKRRFFELEEVSVISLSFSIKKRERPNADIDAC